MNSLNLKRNLSKLWPSANTNRKLILLYHSVGDHTWSTKKREFIDQIKWLHDFCNVVPISSLIANNLNDKISVSLTFDDGYVSLFDTALPILMDHKMVATVYVNTGFISQDETQRYNSEIELGHYPDEAFLTWKEVKILSNLGWEIGSHGVNHVDFSQLNDHKIQAELLYSKEAIEENLNSNCIHFSYPWGKYSKKTQHILKKTNYQYAVAARHGMISNDSDPFALARINVASNYSLNDFIDIVRGKWDYMRFIHKFKGL